MVLGVQALWCFRTGSREIVNVEVENVSIKIPDLVHVVNDPFMSGVLVWDSGTLIDSCITLHKYMVPRFFNRSRVSVSKNLSSSFERYPTVKVQ